MATNRQFVARMPATYTDHVYKIGGVVTGEDDDIYGSGVNYTDVDNEAICVYEWDLSTSVTTFMSTSIVTKIELEYYYQEADSGAVGPAGSWDIKYVTSGQPSGLPTAFARWACINSTGVDMITDTPRGDQKTIRRVTVADGVANAACVALTARIASGSSDEWWGMGLQKADTTPGEMETGGLVMAKGLDTAWHEATGSLEPAGAPAMILTLEQTPSVHIQHLMKYTTTDPTTNQNTPSNSIGGHASSNNVYTRAQIDEPVGSLQTTIPISTISPSVLPTSTGLAQLGPEIMKFEGIDATNEQLTSVTRGISPGFSFPAAVSPFAEYIHYLDVDQLFDRRPNASLIQYRCVALSHFVTNTAQTARNTKVYLVQDLDAEVQVDIGIEVPKHDYIGPFALAGSVTLKDAVSEGASVFTSDNAIWSNYDNEFFNGSYVVIDPDALGSGVHEAIIESFEISGGVAEFIIDTPMAAHNAGEQFEVHPAPSQIISNESAAPTDDSGRFLGFLQDGGSGDISYGGIRERAGRMIHKDVIYIWIKRTFQDKKKAKADTGAIIITIYDEDLS